MSEQSLVEEVQAAKEIWDDAERTPLPETLQQATGQRWILAMADAIQVGALVHYPAEQQDADDDRIITMEAAEKLLADFEEALIDALVAKPEAIMRKQLSALPRAILAGIKGAWQIATHWNDIERIWPYVGEVIRNVLEITGAATLVKTIESGVKVRDQWCEKVRKKALPQRHGPRYRRKRVSSR